ncbi:hypothetical protein QV13_02830 [Mesorhizobium hungaricum]|uniref:Uncharacterized protein n=1 Tax=Mesorhizobium hungaricum TaxID=1566387 RepID=A0A1C2E9Z2_9HYPH|nr:hypothetical protein QV13_02830 [Mesorhizobium hungaricum]
MLSGVMRLTHAMIARLPFRTQQMFRDIAATGQTLRQQKPAAATWAELERPVRVRHAMASVRTALRRAVIAVVTIRAMAHRAADIPILVTIPTIAVLLAILVAA